MLVNKLHGFRTCNDYNVFGSSCFCDADIGSILITSFFNCRGTGIDLFIFLFASLSPEFWSHSTDLLLIRTN